jgi:hypothetical protein
MALPEIEPFYTEADAAKRLGIEFTWLRAERYAGRIGWKKVAGPVMYRHQDLVDWQKRGISPCQEADPPPNRGSSTYSARVVRPSTKSTGTTDSGSASVQRAQAAAEKLIKSSHAGSRTTKTSNADSPPARVIPLKRG